LQKKRRGQAEVEIERNTKSNIGVRGTEKGASEHKATGEKRNSVLF
jgi:hypothetical protein